MSFRRFFLCSAGRDDCTVRVPNIGMRFCVMRLTILLSPRAMKLSRCGVVAQLAEHHNGIVGVVSSNLIDSTRGTGRFRYQCAEVVKLADTHDSGSCASRHGGSSPPFGTRKGELHSPIPLSCFLKRANPSVEPSASKLFAVKGVGILLRFLPF